MAEQIVELAPGESRAVSFEAIPHEAKSYLVLVDGLNGSFTAIPSPEPLTVDILEIRHVGTAYSQDFWAKVVVTNNTGVVLDTHDAIDTGLTVGLLHGPDYTRGAGLSPKTTDTWRCVFVPGKNYFSLYEHRSLAGAQPLLAGEQGYADVRAFHMDKAPTPVKMIYDVHGHFKGIYSSAWKTWQKTDWRPPVFEPPF